MPWAPSPLARSCPPDALAGFEYLGQQKELAIVQVAQQTFPFGVGAIVLLFSGLVSTMSALNATTFSSSRVSFAMGRDHNLPALFARIHPVRRTPHWAIIFSGALMIVMAWALPIDDVAAATDIMFLLLFLQVNVAVMTLRRKMPDLVRGFVIPWFPAIPLMAIMCNTLLSLYLFTFSATAWYTAVGWMLVGLLAYYAHFSKIEAMEKPKEILMEEALVSRDYSVLVVRSISNLR
ncbi:MAG: amino acid permease [Chloroflexi bacterium]|nr:amino acid permease [Chloroflexota bacterium]